MNTCASRRGLRSWSRSGSPWSIRAATGACSRPGSWCSRPRGGRPFWWRRASPRTRPTGHSSPRRWASTSWPARRSEEHTSELQSQSNLVCRLLLEKKTVIAYYVHTVNIQTACLIMEGAEFTENIINGVERPVKAAELFAFTLRVRAGNTDVLTDVEENVS